MKKMARATPTTTCLCVFVAESTIQIQHCAQALENPDAKGADGADGGKGGKQNRSEKKARKVSANVTCLPNQSSLAFVYYCCSPCIRVDFGFCSALQAMQKMGMKPVTGIVRVTVKKAKNVRWSQSQRASNDSLVFFRADSVRADQAGRVQIACLGHLRHLRRGQDRGHQLAGSDAGCPAVQPARCPASRQCSSFACTS